MPGRDGPRPPAPAGAWRFTGEPTQEPSAAGRPLDMGTARRRSPQCGHHRIAPQGKPAAAGLRAELLQSGSLHVGAGVAVGVAHVAAPPAQERAAVPAVLVSEPARATHLAGVQGIHPDQAPASLQDGRIYKSPQHCSKMDLSSPDFWATQVRGLPAVPPADLVMSRMGSLSKATWARLSASARDVLCAGV